MTPKLRFPRPVALGPCDKPAGKFRASSRAASARRCDCLSVSLRRKRPGHTWNPADTGFAGSTVEADWCMGNNLRTRVHDVCIRVFVRVGGARAIRHDARRGGGRTRGQLMAETATSYASAADAGNRRRAILQERADHLARARQLHRRRTCQRRSIRSRWSRSGSGYRPRG